MLKVILCDDSKAATQRYADWILRTARKHDIEVQLSCFESGEVLLFHFCEAADQADIIYLDVLMDKLDGIETAKRLRTLGCNAQIVFLTSCSDYVFQAFDVEAVHYLLKTETLDQRFESVFLKASARVAQQREKLFMCEYGGVKKVVPISRIAYFEIWRRIVTVYFGEGQSAKFYGTMEQLTQRFCADDFVRVHRSYMVHLPYISQLHAAEMVLKTGDVIPIGGTYAPHLKKAFSDYVLQRHVYREAGSTGGVR